MLVGKYNKITLEPHEEAYIKTHFHKRTNRELADVLGLKLTRFRQLAYAMGLKRMELEYWTNEQIEFLRANYKEIGDSELAEVFEVKWHKEKGWTKKHIEKKRRYLKLKRTKAQINKIHKRNVLMGRFKICPIKAWETMGQAPDGEKRVWYHQDNSPFVVIKTKTGFVHYNPWLWEQHYGKPAKGMVIRNFSTKLLDVKITDLKLITREENARLNSKNRLPEHLRETQKLIRTLNKTIHKIEKS
ncbi:hypothetical protein [Bizionia sp.]|uniref:hypothetical protein n=1 Tax=Bizionia sp. TaxID=1954480 RepID=UPI003A951399